MAVIAAPQRPALACVHAPQHAQTAYLPSRRPGSAGCAALTMGRTMPRSTAPEADWARSPSSRALLCGEEGRGSVHTQTDGNLMLPGPAGAHLRQGARPEHTHSTPFRKNTGSGMPFQKFFKTTTKAQKNRYNMKRWVPEILGSLISFSVYFF